MDEMASVRTGQVVGALVSGVAGILTIIITSVIQIITIKAMAKLSLLAPKLTTPSTSYYPFPYPYPYLNTIQYKYVDYHHLNQLPQQVYHQVCQWLVMESGQTKTIYRISTSSGATINTTQIIITIPTPTTPPLLIRPGEETEERKNDRINIIRVH